MNVRVWLLNRSSFVSGDYGESLVCRWTIKKTRTTYFIGKYVTPCSLVIYQYFEGTYRLHLHCRRLKRKRQVWSCLWGSYIREEFCLLRYKPYLQSLLPALCSFLVLLTPRPWRWRRYVPSKRWLTFTGLHGVISQKVELLRIKSFCYLLFYGCSLGLPSGLRVEVVGYFSQTIRRHISEDNTLHSHRSENLKSHILHQDWNWKPL
jgi:hypothetical protein